MASFQSQEPALELASALNEPQKNRDMELAKESMPNFKSTPGTVHNLPLTFSASWTLASRPRRIALLLDDVQEEYRPFAEGIIPNLVKLTDSFRAKGCPIMWSTWSRQFDDGVSNAMDRWYGPRGLRTDEPENALYLFEGEKGLEPLQEILPTAKERTDGWFYHSAMLDMFWLFRPSDGKSYLDEKLKDEGVDTVVIAGLWYVLFVRKQRTQKVHRRYTQIQTNTNKKKHTHTHTKQKHTHKLFFVSFSSRKSVSLILTFCLFVNIII